MSDGESKSVIAAIKKMLKNGTDPVAALNGTFAGWTVLVVSAGPSAKRWREVYDSLDSTRLAVLCVKQSIEMDGLTELCDLHVCNAWNLRRYRYDTRNVLRLYANDDSCGPSYQSWDIRFQINMRQRGLSGAIAVTGDWDAWTLANTGLERPWGPGLMYEGVFHTLLHCGFTTIHTVGWDIADPSGKNQHFYDEPDVAARGLTFASSNDRPGILHRLQRRADNFWRFATGKNYNKALMLEGEAELVANSVPVLRRWLEGKGVSLTIHSQSRWIVDDSTTATGTDP